MEKSLTLRKGGPRSCRRGRDTDIAERPNESSYRGITEGLKLCCVAFFTDALVGSYREAILARLGFYNPKRPVQTAHGQAPPPPRPPPQNLPSEAASLGPLGSCPQHRHHRDRQPCGDAPAVGESHPRGPEFPGWAAGSGRVGSAHRCSLAARLPQSPAGNKKTARAAWKSPPGPTPEGDSGGLASRLGRDPGARLQEAGQPRHRRRHPSPPTSAMVLQIPSVNRGGSVPASQVGVRVL